MPYIDYITHSITIMYVVVIAKSRERDSPRQVISHIQWMPIKIWKPTILWKTTVCGNLNTSWTDINTVYLIYTQQLYIT